MPNHLKKNAKTPAIVTHAAHVATAASKRAEELLELIARRKDAISESFYDIGEALHELMHKKLYAALGFRSFAAMLAKRDIMGRSQAYRLMSVTRELTRSRAVALGPTKAAALAALAHATPQPDTAGSLVDDGLRIGRRKHDVTKLSVRQLVDATREVRPARKVAPDVRAAEHDARAITRALRSRDRRAEVVVKRRAGRFMARITMELGAAKALAGV